ncbi:hypothetical protein ACFYNO_32650 [Kitasatospora sp. NPDC006697]|uniref:hypothetical protein n=1 Tax=Kitasatospora sp. NPDC006697 TaxID=3364020 RepID=UPI0036A124BC
MTALQPDQWDLLARIAAVTGGWLVDNPAAPDRRRRATIVRALADEGLCELAPDEQLNLRKSDGRSPGWAARILPDGLLALRYRELHTASATGELPHRPPVPAGIELSASELDTLRHFTALAPLLPGARTRELADALAQAVPGPGSRTWTVPATTSNLDAIEAAFRLEMLTGASTSRSYHRIRRERPTGSTPARLTATTANQPPQEADQPAPRATGT